MLLFDAYVGFSLYIYGLPFFHLAQSKDNMELVTRFQTEQYSLNEVHAKLAAKDKELRDMEQMVNWSPSILNPCLSW